MIKITNKDIIFCCIVAMWLISNIIAFIITPTYGFVSNILWIFIFAIIVFVKVKNTKFRTWLETPIKKELKIIC